MLANGYVDGFTLCCKHKPPVPSRGRQRVENCFQVYYPVTGASSTGDKERRFNYELCRQKSLA